MDSKGIKKKKTKSNALLITYNSQAKDSQGALANQVKVRKNVNLLSLTSSDLQKSNKDYTSQSLSSSSSSRSSKSILEDQNNLVLATDNDSIPIKVKATCSPNDRSTIDN